MGRRTRAAGAALPPVVVVKIAGIFIRAVKAAVSEIKEAKSPDSDGGKKVTLEEAMEIVEVVFASVFSDLADAIAGN